MAFRVFVAVTASLLATASVAHATSMTMSLGYTAIAAAQNSTYAPTINDDGQPYLVPGNQTWTVGSTTSPATFLQIAPVSGGSSVGTQMGAIDVVLTLLGPNNSAVTSISTSAGGDTATLSNGKISFEAYYDLFYAANPQTDCLVWNGNGHSACTATGNTSTIGETVTAHFSDGAVLAINLYNWSDWDMTPDISFDLISGPTAVPEPSTLAMFGSAIAGLAMLRRRRQVEIDGSP
jgi:hypothetical protein